MGCCASVHEIEIVSFEQMPSFRVKEFKAERRSYPVYVIDLDKPASLRYNKMFEDLKEPLLEMETFWYDQIPQESRLIIENNMDKYKAA